MNSLKNLMILAVLAAVGYGVYVSLSRNNVDTAQTSGGNDGWPTVSQGELRGTRATATPGGPLALGGNSSRPAGGMAPPFSSSAMPGTTDNSPGGMAGASPYPSSTPPTAPGLTPSAPTLGSGATLGPPGLSSDTTMPALPSTVPGPPPGGPSFSGNTVRNLTPPPGASTSSDGASPKARPAEGVLQAKFAAFLDAVRKKLEEGKYAEAHLALSMMYFNPDLPTEQARQITELLDQLAGTVIYSRQHCLESAYVTRPGDTLEKIAQQYSVPWQLLARINALMPQNPASGDDGTKDQPLPVGIELKVVRGPFDAVIHLDKHELTLKVQNRYAGRFSIGIGQDQPKLDGEYTVCTKTLAPAYYAPDGTMIRPNDPRNPLGGAWIGLTDRIGIHGVGDPHGIGRDDNRGTIAVGDRDLQDLYGILSVGSRVTVVR